MPGSAASAPSRRSGSTRTMPGSAASVPSRWSGSVLHDAGLGSIRPEQTVGLGPDDAGLGSIRPEQTVGLARGPQGFMVVAGSTLVRSQPPVIIGEEAILMSGERVDRPDEDAANNVLADRGEHRRRPRCACRSSRPSTGACCRPGRCPGTRHSAAPRCSCRCCQERWLLSRSSPRPPRSATGS